MSVLHNGRIFSYLNRRILCRVETDEKRLALTFDDGPHPKHTPQLLDMLKRKGVPATFFVVGRRVKRFPHILKRIAHAGHEIGNHTFHHLPLPLLPSLVIRRQLANTEHLITKATGQRSMFMRPPGGWFTNRVLDVARAMGYQPVIGTVHPQDSRRPGEETIVERVHRRIQPGAIIILHDGGWSLAADRSETVTAADRLTDKLLEHGYRFETLSQLANGSSLDS
jgi:peptidoglycan/xylan/chitin deacetylase (PgdA/CDA1 family)